MSSISVEGVFALFIMYTIFLAPMIILRGKWFWLFFVGIGAYFCYEWVQIYLFRADINNKLGIGHMLGEVIALYLTTAFILSFISIMLVRGYKKYFRGK